jgi:hypothetical protein
MIDVMTTTRIRAFVWTLTLLALPLGFVLHPSQAFAHSVVHWSDAGPVCTPLASESCIRDGDCIGTDESCRAFEGDDRLCAPVRAAYCTTEADRQCPVDRPRRVRILDVEFCVSDLYRNCSIPPRTCFSRTSGGPTVDWNFGDCDGDAQANALDPAPCEAASIIATVDATGSCNPTRALCVNDGDCGDGLLCRHVSTANPNGYCVPSGELVFCCGGFVGAECPLGDACSPNADDGFDLCHPYCGDANYEDRLKCLEFGGIFPVPAALGDCDGDGLRNRTEVEIGTDPCIGGDAGVVVIDAGTTADASVIDRDANVVNDASVPTEDASTNDLDGSRAESDGSMPVDDAGSAKMDGSTEDEMNFAGGGGCLCGVGSRHRAAPWSIAIVALMLVCIRQRSLDRPRRE